MGDHLRDNWKKIVVFLFIAFILWRGFIGCMNILNSRAELSPSEQTATVTAQRDTIRSAQRLAALIPTSTPRPTTTPRPRYTPTPDIRDYRSSINQPMPIGLPIGFTDGTTIFVEDVTKNANQIIKRHDAWTEPPPRGASIPYRESEGVQSRRPTDRHLRN